VATVRDHLIDLINQDPRVLAFSGRLVHAHPAEGGASRVSRATASYFPPRATMARRSSSRPLMWRCGCANSGMVTDDNPAVAGETIIVYATGLGLSLPQFVEHTGIRYDGGITDPNAFVSSLAGGKTANVLLATLKPGEVGIYEVHLELNSDLATDPRAQMTIAQDIYVSNIVTFPVVNPNPPPAQ